MERRICKTVNVGGVPIGGTAPIAVQSMGNIPSYDVEGTVRQARALREAGCDIFRIAVPNKEAVRLVDAVKSAVDIPLVADIHFDYTLALESRMKQQLVARVNASLLEMANQALVGYGWQAKKVVADMDIGEDGCISMGQITVYVDKETARFASAVRQVVEKRLGTEVTLALWEDTP